MRPQEGGLCTRSHTYTHGTRTLLPWTGVYTHLHAWHTQTHMCTRFAGGQRAPKPDQVTMWHQLCSGGHGASGDSRAGLGAGQTPSCKHEKDCPTAAGALGVSTAFASSHPGPAARGPRSALPAPTFLLSAPPARFSTRLHAASPPAL